MHNILESTAITVEEMRNHPERFVDLILANNDHSLMLERDADVIRITVLKRYTQHTRQLVAEARQAYIAQQASGYSREQAFQDLLAAQTEIAEQLSNSK